MTKMIFVYIWEYIVREKHQGDFKKIYGPEGDWVQLFRNCEGYIATDLHQDTSNPNRIPSKGRARNQSAWSNNFDVSIGLKYLSCSSD